MSECTAACHVGREELFAGLPASFGGISKQRETSLGKECCDEANLLLAQQAAGFPRDVLLVPNIPIGVFADGFTSSRARNPRQEDDFLCSLPGMCSDSFLHIAGPELIYSLTLKRIACTVIEHHVNIGTLLSVSLPANGMNGGIREKLFQKRLTKPLEAFRAEPVHGKRLIEGRDGFFLRVASSNQQFVGGNSQYPRKQRNLNSLVAERFPPPSGLHSAAKPLRVRPTLPAAKCQPFGAALRAGGQSPYIARLDPHSFYVCYYSYALIK